MNATAEDTPAPATAEATPPDEPKPAKRPARRSRKAKPTTFRILFEAGGERYAVIPLRPDPEVASHAARLKKSDGTTYDVRLDTESGLPVCECPGYVQHGLCKDGKGCVHVRMLVAAGIFPAFVVDEKR
jgi:hypothetical protein